MLISKVDFSVKPWYRQFYLRRGQAEWASDQVTTEGYEARMEAIGGFAFVGTEMYGSPTRVTVEVYDSEAPTVENAERSVEVSVDEDGPISILSWGEDVAEAVVDVPAGPLRLRGSWFGLSSTVGHPDYDSGGDAESPERVLFQVWPAPMDERVVLRPWPGAA